MLVVQPRNLYTNGRWRSGGLSTSRSSSLDTLCLLFPTPTKECALCPLSNNRYLHDNLLNGTLPDAWAAPDSFTALKMLTLVRGGGDRLAAARIRGPMQRHHAFPKLNGSILHGCAPFGGGVRLLHSRISNPTYSMRTCLCCNLSLCAWMQGQNPLVTAIPQSWMAAGAWPVLESLNISHAELVGTLPEAAGGLPKLEAL